MILIDTSRGLRQQFICSIFIFVNETLTVMMLIFSFADWSVHAGWPNFLVGEAHGDLLPVFPILGYK